jgi:hypothetical protein
MTANFLATKTINQNYVTGFNAAPTPLYNNIVYDDGSNYNAATGVFTASANGTYVFNVSIKIGGMVPYNTLGTLYFNKNGTSFYRAADMNVYVARNMNSQLNLQGSITIKLNAGDTIKPDVSVVGNSSNNVSLIGDYSYFSGKQI